MPVPHFAKRPLAALAALSLVLAACSDSSAPDAPFDPTGTSADLATTVGAFDSPILASYGTISSQIGDVVGGPSASVATMSLGSLTNRATAAQYAQQLLTKLQPRLGGGPNFSTSAIPQEFAGKTFEYDVETSEYVATDRTGAPANGVRFVLYELDTETMQPVTPLVEVGYAQLTATESGASQSVHLTVIATPSNVTYFDYTLTATYTSSTLTLGVTGFVTNGTDRVNFNATVHYNSDQQIVFAYVFSVPTTGFRLETAVTVDVAASTVSLSITARGPHGRVNITGSATEAGDGTFNVFVNGDLFAKITASGSTTTFVDANDQPLDGDELDTLQGLFQLLYNGFGFFDNLVGLFIPV